MSLFIPSFELKSDFSTEICEHHNLAGPIKPFGQFTYFRLALNFKRPGGLEFPANILTVYLQN